MVLGPKPDLRRLGDGSVGRLPTGVRSVEGADERWASTTDCSAGWRSCGTACPSSWARSASGRCWRCCWRNAGTVLSTDRILDELWGEAGGTDKQSSLWVYVSGLRGALEPGRAKRSEGTILLTRAPGYVLAVDRDDTDVGRFERSVAEARVLAETDPAGASATLRDRARHVARSRLRGVRLRVVGAGRDRPARGAPPGGDREPDRRRPAARAVAASSSPSCRAWPASTRCASASSPR